MGALCGDWKEANEGIVTIDDVVPAARESSNSY